MYDKYQYGNAYFQRHDDNVMNTVANVIRGTFRDVKVFVNNNRTVTVFGDVTKQDLVKVVALFGDAVFDVDVGGFFDDGYDLFFNCNLVDADD